MIRNLTIHIVARNNEETIEDCLKSIDKIDAEILVADIGSNDKTIEICKKYNCNIKKISYFDDMSYVRNKLISTTETDWIMSINPWETLIHGDCLIEKTTKESKNGYRFNIFQNDIITKEIRLWHKETNLIYKNPVHESLSGNFDLCDVYLKSLKNITINEQEIRKWMNNNPLSNAAIYYMSCHYLTEKKWDSFINFAEMYLHQEKKTEVSYYMTHYYLGMVLSYVKKEYQRAIKHVMICLSKMPTMAEFWCLCGDIFFALKDYKRAISMYENAEIMGQSRLRNDEFPVEVSKYKEYPTKMILNCKKIESSKKLYGSES